MLKVNINISGDCPPAGIHSNHPSPVSSLRYCAACDRSMIRLQQAHNVIRPTQNNPGLNIGFDISRLMKEESNQLEDLLPRSSLLFSFFNTIIPLVSLTASYEKKITLWRHSYAE